MGIREKLLPDINLEIEWVLTPLHNGDFQVTLAGTHEFSRITRA